jgi:hypothetical protein
VTPIFLVMIMKMNITFLLLSLSLVVCATPVLAIEVYQWTDEDGVVHFSQVAPEDHIESVKTLEVMGEEEMGNGLGISEDDDPYGYKAHREEMDALWAEREARREAARQRQAAAAPSTQIVYVQQETPYPYIYPGYGYRPPHKPERPPHRPEHPVVKPSTLKRP